MTLILSPAVNFYTYSILSLKMINPLTSSLPKQGYWVPFIPENIIPDNIMQNLLNLSMYYARRFLHLSLLSISSYTVHCFGKMVKRKFQEELYTHANDLSTENCRRKRTEQVYDSPFMPTHFSHHWLDNLANIADKRGTAKRCPKTDFVRGRNCNRPTKSCPPKVPEI